jgi:hypothetical protein
MCPCFSGARIPQVTKEGLARQFKGNLMPRARVTISVLILHQVTRDKTAHTRGEGEDAGGKGEGYM